MYLHSLIKNHIDYCQNSSFKVKLNLQDIGVLRSLANDFDDEYKKINQQNLLALNDKSSVESEEEFGMINGGDPNKAINDPNDKSKKVTFQINSNMEMRGLTENLIFLFEKTITKFHTVNVFSPSEIVISGKQENVVPHYLKI